jgi:hypothetical protein
MMEYQIAYSPLNYLYSGRMNNDILAQGFNKKHALLVDMHIFDHTGIRTLNFVNPDKYLSIENLQIFNICSNKSKIMLSTSITFTFGCR